MTFFSVFSVTITATSIQKNQLHSPRNTVNVRNPIERSYCERADKTYASGNGLLLQSYCFLCDFNTLDWYPLTRYVALVRVRAGARARAARVCPDEVK